MAETRHLPELTEVRAAHRLDLGLGVESTMHDPNGQARQFPLLQPLPARRELPGAGWRRVHDTGYMVV